jgi:hypothetical protein
MIDGDMSQSSGQSLSKSGLIYPLEILAPMGRPTLRTPSEKKEFDREWSFFTGGEKPSKVFT